MDNFAELEKIAKKYTKLKKQKSTDSKNALLGLELNKTVIGIIDRLSSRDFMFPIQRNAVVSGKTTTYIYRKNSTYPNLFEFISDILHTRIPIIISSAKFGPGEIIVNSGNEKSSRRELELCTKELQRLLSSKKP
ncbi:MAG TPA: hypothetical protein VJR67_00905 [Candidatus Nitrosopolaris sp.]|nr:hypothetical protein [Candidatus Nitrosopolaris sp.]